MKRKKQPTMYLLVELLGIFMVAPTIIVFMMPIPILPFLWLVALICYRILLNDKTFNRASLWRISELKPHLKTILSQYALITIILSLGIYLFMPEQFLSLLKTNPIVWLLIMVFYPILSVYPQELLYRTFFFHRYGELFKSRQKVIWGSAIVFSYMHIIFQNHVAVLLTLGGGWIFASIYEKTNSIFVVSLVHTLYGNLIFTLGLGEYFFHGTMSIMLKLS